MKTVKIYSKNAAYQKFEVLKTNRNKRHRYGEFFVEGVRNINEAEKNGWRFSSFLYSSERSLSGWAKEKLASVKTDVNYELAGGLMEELSEKQDTSELLAVVRMREDSVSQLRMSENPLLVLFDRSSNHGNLGTIIRSCDSLGVDGLILTGHGVDLYDPAVVTASMGSFFHVPVIRMADTAAVLSFFSRMREKYSGFQLVGTTAHNETRLSDVDFCKPTLVMIGNETEGLCRAFKEQSDILATIPMSGTSSASSFNVACAATVILYEAVRQRLSSPKDL